MSKPYKKVKASLETTDERIDLLARTIRRPPKIIEKYIKSGAFGSITPEQIRTMQKMIENLSESAWIDYVYFLLNPIRSPRKVKIPGFITNPIGSVVREFKGFMSFTTTNTPLDVSMVWAPGLVYFDGTDATSTNSLLFGQKTANVTPDVDTNWTTYALGPYWPSGVSTFFTEYRLLAAELRVNCIESTLAAQGRVVSAPSYNSGNENRPGITIRSGGPNSSVLNKSINELFDSKIVRDKEMVDGLRLVYLPAQPESGDFIQTNHSSNNYPNTGQNSRIDYNAIIRGLPPNTKVEAYVVYYYEFQVNQKQHELINDPTTDNIKPTKGNYNEVLGALSEHLSIFNSIVDDNTQGNILYYFH